ncbi:hypothetical protein K493DRAFT_306982 [Basidiobolus meristosporus CBS 931.73]|uniref:Uncharacterized protein n=1 Tax=Basidiobolus meristosporus CBS 931.73 TaxID=1314790 RepID=A0A1Y1XMG0_9FUNG|nr:hypothetical protein K493DRAFT_306982 [Basidiobolus meristosporus CBS 931.73]|eukprot:ORX86939.1 hypothetical protein K493DRAFT_306982 [Basidiobolus meristosporus CBS 931.73]
MSKLLGVIIFLALACLALVRADPLVDIPHTSLDMTVSEIPNYSRRVAIAIDRVDDLVGEGGALVAAKFSHVVLDFEITKDQVKLNGVPIQMGTSNIKIDASLALTPQALMISPDQVLGAFDQGVVGLEVTATRDKLYNSTLRRDVDRVILEEIITEVNGCEVVQTDISQQIIDLDDEGGYMPSLKGELAIPEPNIPPTVAEIVYRRIRESDGLDYLHDEEYARIAQYEAELEDEKFDSYNSHENQRLMH